MFENWYKCLPMYDDINRQHRTENEVVNEQINWQTWNNYLLPFQIIRDKNPSTSWVFRLYTHDGILYRNLMTGLLAAQIKVNTVTGSDIIQFIATQSVTEVECGAYYYYFSDGINEWWSEIFAVKNEAKEIGVGMAIIDGLEIIIVTPSLPLVPAIIGDPIIAEKS